jgi:transposase
LWWNPLVIRIESEQNIEVLRQVARLLWRENEALHERLRKLTAEKLRLQGADAKALQLEIDQLQELLARREREIFGASSEKRPRPTIEAAAEPAERNGHGPREQKQLPIVETRHELPEGERCCPQCGGKMEEMGEQVEESEEVTVVERSFRLVRHRRQKYRCRCNGSVVTAPGPARLIPGGRYSPEFAVEVAINKYLDHAPLERQVRIMEREGLTVTSQTLWDQIEALARHLEPSYAALRPRVLGSAVVYADETHWRLMGREEETSRWWVWCVANEEAVFYQLLGTRSAKAARSVLSGYRGIVLCDGYGAYEALARAGPDITLAHCWAHVRRKFIEIESHYPRACGEILQLISKLYRVEMEVPRLGFPEAAERLALRAKLREERARPLIREISAWAEDQRQKALPRSGLGQATEYLLGMWKGLTRFLEDPRIPLDNNAAERALRGVVIGRKNHYGSRSKRGTEVAALFYSLCETAKLAGVEPRAYLLQATHAALEKPGTVTLPHDLRN